MPRAHQRHAPEIVAQATIALLRGESVSSVARRLRVPKGTVSDWRRRNQEMVGLDDWTYRIAKAALRPIPRTNAERWAAMQARKEAARRAEKARRRAEDGCP